MLGKLILVLLQIAIAGFLGPLIYSQIPVSGEYGLFVYALIFALAVFVTGLLGSYVLKEVDTPSSATLTATLLIALLGASAVKFAGPLLPHLNAVSQRNMVLASAILGYFLRK